VRTAARVAESLARRRIPPLRRPAVGVGEGLRVYADLGSAQGLRLFRYGLRLPEAGLLERLLRPGDVFVDGGANIGLFSLPAARRVGPTGRVLAFEPAGRAADALAANAALNGFDWITVDRRALSDRVGESEFVELDGDGAGFSSFAPGFPGVLRRVATTTLDAAAAGLDVRLVKLDVEGAEARALRGAEGLLDRSRPDLLVEVEPGHLARQSSAVSDLDALLRRHGYRLFELVPGAAPGLRGLASAGELANGPNLFASADLRRLASARLLP
jgi:FkbM family methyltransferase